MTDAADIRRFDLIREEDESGVSGTGVVAVGIEFPNGYVELQWLNDDGMAVDSLGVPLVRFAHSRDLAWKRDKRSESSGLAGI